jgi:hypothetical protein
MVYPRRIVMGDIEKAAHALYEAGRKLGLGVRVVFATSDMSGLKNASPEEAEQILANAAIKIRLDISKQCDAAHTADPVSTGDGVGSPFYVMLDDFAFFPPPGDDLGFIDVVDGMKDALSSFASDLHEVFRKHEMLVAAGRAECVQLAVSRKLLDLLGQHEGAEGYLGNLHII